jgi:hypothetical protein
MGSYQTAVVASLLVVVTAFARPARAADKVTDANLQAASTSAAISSPSLPAAPPEVGFQEDQPTVLGARFGGYCGPEMKGTGLSGIAAILVGVQGGWVINERFVVGAAGYALATTQAPSQKQSRPEGPSHLQFGYGGARFAYVERPYAPLHFTAGVLVGGGGVSVLTEDRVRDISHNHDGGGFFALEPGADVEINLHRHVRLALGGSYRLISGFDQPRLHTSDLSGPAGSVTIRFGSF